ncbi:MAG: hypothetical protein K9H25_17165 [Rhodospirillum sp.]|nr:hypothetical protein [Rhodospirillum sp.]MCF8501782.1 hypothetical protein [Rhodospirillum sp.]
MDQNSTDQNQPPEQAKEQARVEKIPLPSDADGADTDGKKEKEPTHHADYRVHFSFSTTVMFWVCTIPAGWTSVLLFPAVYGTALALGVFAEVKCADGMRRDEAGFLEWRLARFPLGVTGFALGIGSFLGAISVVVPLSVFVFCAFSSGWADAHAWKGPRS